MTKAGGWLLSTTLIHTGELAQRVDAVTAAGAGRALRRGSLRFGRTVALPVGIQGPTAGVIIGPAIIASIVSEPGALAQVLALAVMGFVAYAFVIFTRAFNTAGSVYTFNAAALGPGYGFVSAWLLLLVYTAFAAGVYAATADIAQALLASLGLHVGWVWLGPATLATYAAGLLRGHELAWPVEDTRQLGADAIMADGVVRLLWRPRTPSDRPPAAQVVAAAKSLLT
jgi:hypothetical protein